MTRAPSISPPSSPPPVAEVLRVLAEQRGVALTAEQCEGLLALVDGYVAAAVELLTSMQDAHRRRGGEAP